MRSSGILLDTAEVLESTLERIDRLKTLSDREKEALKRKIAGAAENFRELSKRAVKDNEELAEFFFKKAKEFKAMSNDRGIEREGKKNYLRMAGRIYQYSLSAEYDFIPDKLKELKKAYRKYIFGMTLFFVLSGLFLNQFIAITALILAIPIILSMLSLQRRGHLGLLLAYSALPIPLVVGFMAMTYSLRTLRDPAEIAKIAGHLGKSTAFAQGYLTVLLLISLVELYLLLDGTVGLYRHRHAFL